MHSKKLNGAWDPAWLETMYNNRLRVSNSADIIENWAVRSANARDLLSAQQRAFLDVSYDTGAKDKLDIFVPEIRKNQETWPVVVYIHGGYWHALDKADHSFIAPPLTEQGMCVVVINYTLCPEVTVPQIVEQVSRAIAWVSENINHYGGDKDRLTVAGHSAGGHLAAMMVGLQNLGTVPSFRNALSLSGLFDLEPLQYTPFLKILGLTPEQVTSASPVRCPRPKSGSLSCAVGGRESEEFIRQNTLLKEAWGQEIVPEVIEVAGKDHFSIVEDLILRDSSLNTCLKKLVLAA